MSDGGLSAAAAGSAAAGSAAASVSFATIAANIAQGLIISAGLSYITSLFNTRKLPGTVGPRMGDVTTMGGSAGLDIPKNFGRVRTSGNVIWRSEGRYIVIPHYHRVKTGGKGGGSKKKTVTTYTYEFRMDLAICWGQGPITAVRAIYAEQIPIFDGRVSPSNLLSAYGSLTNYSGSEDQLPDAVMEGALGVGNCPAYRGLTYTVIQNFLLAESHAPINAVTIPTFTALIDGANSVIRRPAEFLRTSNAKSLTSANIEAGQYVYDPLSDSPWRFRSASYASDMPLYGDATPQMTYAGIVTAGNNLATTFPDMVISEVIGQSFGNRDQVCLRINDDGIKPIIVIGQGIHGDERDGAVALFDWLELFCGQTAVNPIVEEDLQVMRDTVAVYVILTVNPDGMADPAISEHGGTGKRENDNGINLNRNWPYYFDATTDADKGAYALSEPETANIAAWLEIDGREKRVMSVLDIHGWNSRNTMGLLLEQEFHDIRSQRTQRSILLHSLHHMEAANWTGVTIVNQNPPTLTEYRSARKPYLYTYVRQRGRPDGWGGVLEYAQAENLGVINRTVFCFLAGLFYGTVDALGTDDGGALLLPACTPLNVNGLMNSFIKEGDVSRPTGFSSTGLRLTHFDVGTSRSRAFIRCYRPDEIGWANAVSGAGYASTSTACYLVAGKTSSTTRTSSTHGEDFSTGKHSFDGSLPVAVQYGAMATDNNFLYFFGGHDGTNYVSKLWRASASDPTAWTEIANLSGSVGGVQRHTMEYYNGKLYIIGGRDATDYRTAVWEITTSGASPTKVADLTTKRGWHCSAIYNGTLFTFGGWDGASTKADTIKVNMSSWVVSAGTSLSFSRAQMGSAAQGELCYLISGRTGSATTVKTMYTYNMDTDVITQIVYDPAVDYNEHGSEAIPDPFLESPAVFVHPTDGYVAIIGGQNASGVQQSTVYILDISSKDLYLRQTSETTWGYIRPVVKFNGVAGETFSLVAAVRNADPINDHKSPYIRLTVFIGPVDAPTRKLRLGYTVPPQDTFHTFVLPFTLLAGETEFRCYLRQYGGGTSVDVSGFQIFKARTATLSFDEGKTEDSISVKFIDPLYEVTPLWTPRSKTGSFSPIFGSQQGGTVKIMDYTITPHSSGSGVTAMSLWYDGIEDHTADVIEGGQTISVATGNFRLQYIANGITYNSNMLSNCQLNHSKLNREWRRDVVHWKIEKFNDYYYEITNHGYTGWEHSTRVDVPVVTFTLWFYGKTQTITLQPMLMGEVSGYTASGVGVTMRSSRNLSEIIQSLCEEAGISSSRIDTTAITDITTGYTVANRSSARSYIDVIRTAYNIDIIESNGKLKFVKRGSGSILSIPAADMIPQGTDGYTVKTVIAQAVELPRQVEVMYYDIDRKFQQNMQRAQRSSFDVGNSNQISLPIAMTATEARRIAERMLYAAFIGRTERTWRTSMKYMRVEPSDVVNIEIDPETGVYVSVLIVNKAEAVDGMISWTGIDDEAGSYVSTVVGGTGLTLTDTLAFPVLSRASILDLAPLSETISDSAPLLGIVVSPAESGGQWLGTVVDRQISGTYNSFYSSQLRGISGVCTTTLGNAATLTIPDFTNTIRVTLSVSSDQLVSISLSELLGGENGAMVGDELIAFQNATLISAGVYDITGLIRGIKGTERFCATHVANERFVIVNSDTLGLVSMTQSDIGTTNTYRATTVGQDVDDGTTQVFTYEGNYWKPISPSNLAASRDGSANITFTWTRRDRFGTAWISSVDIPMSETTESYSIDIYNGATIVRTLVSSTPTVAYSAANQITDFGSTQSSVKIRVYQISSRVGRGHYREATI